MAKFTAMAALISLLLMRREDSVSKVEADEEYDFVIVGSGPTGSVVASRLSEDPNTKVLLLEAGGSDLSDPRIQVPYLFLGLQGTSLDWNYEIVPQKNAMRNKNGVGVVHAGKVLGGSTTIGANDYVRGGSDDYNTWMRLGATGWGWRDVEPFFQRVENATMQKMSQRLGRGGPLKLSSNLNQATPATKKFFDAAAELSLPTNDYMDDLLGVSFVTSTTYQGIRQNAATAYLRPILHERKDRLHVVLEAHVTRILITSNTSSAEKSRAYGVQYRKNGNLFNVRARKEVILSAGAYNTPQLLMLSGIGPRDHLMEHRIEVIVDSPGVGHGLQDHVYHRQPLHFPHSLVTKNQELQYIMDGRGTLVTAYFRPSMGKSSANMRKRQSPDIELLFGDAKSNSSPSLLWLVKPKSTGTLKLKSANPDDLPLIDPNYYSNEEDIFFLLKGFRWLEKFEESRAFKHAGIKVLMPNYCNRSENIETPRSDEYYRCLLMQGSVPGHTCCTAKMGRKTQKYSVLDHRLRVYGVDGLRVADASVMPRIISANTQATCYMIGEKAAHMMKEDWNMP